MRLTSEASVVFCMENLFTLPPLSSREKHCSGSVSMTADRGGEVLIIANCFV